MYAVKPGCKMFPAQLPNTVRSSASRAEVRLYDEFQRQLGPAWLVFYSVSWLAPVRADEAPRDGETDFILAHPDKGILLLEVKGGRIAYNAERRQWTSTDRFDQVHDIEPFQQAVKNKYSLLHKLKTLPRLAGMFIPLCHGVAFPDAGRPDRAYAPEAPPEIIIGSDDLDRLTQRIEAMIAYGQTQPWPDTGAQIVSELRRALGQSVELKNPLAREAAEEDRELVRLTEQQFSLLRNLGNIPRAAIGGPAGSGKTFLALEKARRLAGEGFQTLLTCFNRPLADHLGEITRGVENLRVATFHAVARELAVEAQLITATARVEPEALPELLLQAVDRLPARRFDAIIVDEGQDFEDFWWVALQSLLREGKESVFYAFHDTHQLLYRGRGSLPSDLLPFPLTENVRNTRSIYQTLSQHYDGEIQVNPRGPVGRTIETEIYTTKAELQKKLAAVLQRLLQVEGFSNQDLVVLTPRSVEKSDLKDFSVPGGLKLVDEEPAPGTRHVLISSVHRFKGLERRVAIVVELDDQMPIDSDRKRLCYVAFSRARTHLVVMGTRSALDQVLPVRKP